MNFVTYTYKEIVSELEEAFNWLREMGIKQPENTRYGKYQKDIKKLDEIMKKGNTIEFLEHTDKPVEQVRNEYANSLHEARELLDIHRNLKDYSNVMLLQPKIKKMVKGPSLPWKENTNNDSNKGRCLAFELLILSYFAKQGFPLNLESDADTEAYVDSYKIFIEAKRPFHNQSITRNIEEAIDQLEKRLKGVKEDGARGLIAISLDRIVMEECSFLQIMESEIEKIIVKRGKKFINDYSHLWSKSLDCRFIGAIISISVPVFVPRAMSFREKLLSMISKIPSDIFLGEKLLQIL